MALTLISRNALASGSDTRTNGKPDASAFRLIIVPIKVSTIGLTPPGSPRSKNLPHLLRKDRRINKCRMERSGKQPCLPLDERWRLEFPMSHKLGRFVATFKCRQ